MATQVKRKADGWLVQDEKGLHRFKTKQEVDAHLGAPAEKKEEASKPEDKDLFSADAQMAVRRRRRTAKKKSVPTNKALYARVKAATKRKFAVYPSAYANAWLVREYKKRGGKYRSG